MSQNSNDLKKDRFRNHLNHIIYRRRNLVITVQSLAKMGSCYKYDL